MNDKLSDLYHRAWIWSEFEDEYKDRPTYERRCVVSLRLFSELIVKECALIAGLMEHEGRKNIGANILDSFGVE